jgi:chloramphenicol 3-O-phosphotransferase
MWQCSVWMVGVEEVKWRRRVERGGRRSGKRHAGWRCENVGLGWGDIVQGKVKVSAGVGDCDCSCVM